MIDYRDDMDDKWHMRLERQRVEDAMIRREHDRAERNIMALVWICAGMGIVAGMAFLVIVSLWGVQL